MVARDKEIDCNDLRLAPGAMALYEAAAPLSPVPLFWCTIDREEGKCGVLYCIRRKEEAEGLFFVNAC
jgi:hypothetical protein